MGITLLWRGKPVFARHRTAAEIDEARKVNLAELRDPQKGRGPRQKGHDNMLILVGICTHLGCIPQGQKPTDPRGGSAATSARATGRSTTLGTHPQRARAPEPRSADLYVPERYHRACGLGESEP